MFANWEQVLKKVDREGRRLERHLSREQEQIFVDSDGALPGSPQESRANEWLNRRVAMMYEDEAVRSFISSLSSTARSRDERRCIGSDCETLIRNHVWHVILRAIYERQERRSKKLEQLRDAMLPEDLGTVASTIKRMHVMELVVEEEYSRYLRRERPNAPALPKQLRRFVMSRDGLTCQYCGRKGGRLDPDGQPWPIDHVVPRKDGGPDSAGNLVLACWSCNQRKGTLSREQFLLILTAGTPS